MQEPNWIITSVVGALIGVLIVPLYQMLIYPFRKRHWHPLCGKWHSYSYSFMDGRLQLRHGAFSVRHGVLQRFVVDRLNFGQYPPLNMSPAPPPLRYRGTLYEEHDHYVVTLEGRTHTESLIFRFVNRVPSNAGVIPGVWMAYDHDLNPAAGTVIISREPLSPDVVVHMLRSWMVFKEGAFHIRKTPARNAHNHTRRLPRQSSKRSVHENPDPVLD